MRITTWGLVLAMVLSLTVAGRAAPAQAADPATAVSLAACAASTSQLVDVSADRPLNLVGTKWVAKNRGQIQDFLNLSSVTVTLGGVALANAGAYFSAPYQTNDQTYGAVWATEWRYTAAPPVVGARLAVHYALALTHALQNLLARPGDPTTFAAGPVVQYVCTARGGLLVGASGGVVRPAAGGATLTIPAGALATDVVITVEAGTPPPPSSFGTPIGGGFTFGPSGTTFATPATLTLGYDPASVAPGLGAGDFYIATSDDGLTWTPIPATVDLIAHTVTAPIAHFSFYVPITFVSLYTQTTGAGSGTLSVSPTGSPCGSGCQSYPVFAVYTCGYYGCYVSGYSFTTVTITESPATLQSYFQGWSGSCSGTAGSCTLTMNGSKLAQASFGLDTTPPVFSGVPAPITAEATSSAGAVVSYATPIAIDAVDGPRPVSCAPGSGSTFAFGQTTVTCSASDTHGNTGTASFTVTVQDTTPPAFSGVPASAIVEATSGAGATFTYTAPSATDSVSGARTVSCAPASGTTFALGTTTVVCTAADTYSNTSSSSFSVTVQDTTPPAISGVPTDRTVTATGPSGAAVSYATPTANDLVDGPVAVLCTPSSGSTFPVGTNTVSCTATDAHGNSASASFHITVNPAVATATWTAKASTLLARDNAAGATDGRYVYVIGGSDGFHDQTDLQRYDPLTDSWTVLAPLPAGRYSGDGAVVINGKLYVPGGWTTSPPLPWSTLFIYDIGSNSWSSGASMPSLSGCGNSVALNGKLYVMTPCNGYSGYTAYLFAYDPGTNAWTVLPSSPHVHTGGAAQAINGRIYLAGGYDGTSTAGWLDIYDPLTNAWTAGSAMPTAVGGGVSGVIGGQLYIAGGQNGSTLLGTVQSYDPTTDHWTTSQAMPTATTAAAGAVVNGALYVAGGYANGAITTATEVFVP